MSSSATETTPRSIVALGASAGGLDALDRFFTALGPTENVAFVVIQHLAPEHRTMMDTLLARHTEMPVSVAEDGSELEPGHVYVIPPGKEMTLVNGQLHIVPRPHTGITLPIDAFFTSLAGDSAGMNVGIVLSGTGSDGTQGALAIAQGGGWVLAQDPATAGFDGMPLNVIATGVADRVGSPEDLAHEVERILGLGLPHPGRPLGETGPSEKVTAEMAVKVLRAVIPLDFSQYKPTTLLRRLERRMTTVGVHTLRAYSSYLARHPEEVHALRQDLLIPVTRFFRDPEAWDVLRERVVRPLAEELVEAPAEPVRVWVAGCATGQEAYTVAMILQETIEETGIRPELKIFATDVEQTYIDRASAGRYTDHEVKEIPETSRKRWFDRQPDGEWQVSSELRQKIVFSRHDLLSDAPFTRLDLVVCRNLLIYLKTAAQDRAIRRMSYALKRGSVLLLGSSESPGPAESDYEVIDPRQKIYRLIRRTPVLPPEDLLMAGVPWQRVSGRRRGLVGPNLPPESPVDVAVRELVVRYTPTSVLVSSDRELVHVFGDSRGLLDLPEGHATLEILQLLPSPLMPVAATLLHAAFRDRKAQRSGPVQIEPQGGERTVVRISVRPLELESHPRDFALISFESIDSPAHIEGAPMEEADLAAMSSAQVADLERELTLTRANLHDTIQELGTANEELQATNEELMASNEELQSTNEELQSVNEELHTLNSEYQTKILQLNEANADLESLTRAPEIPLLFLDDQLRISRLTPAVTRLFSVREADIGRPITDFSHRLQRIDLFDEVARSAREGVVFRDEIADLDGGTWLVTAVPHPSRDGGAARIVIACIDVSSLRDVQRLQGVMDALPEHVAVLDGMGRIQMVNRSWQAFAERNGDVEARRSGVGTSYLDVCRAPAVEDGFAQRALEGIAGVLDRSRPHFMMYYPCHSPEEDRWFVMHVSPLEMAGCVVSHFNITGYVDPSLIEGFSQATDA